MSITLPRWVQETRRKSITLRKMFGLGVVMAWKYLGKDKGFWLLCWTGLNKHVVGCTRRHLLHYSDVIMGAMASQITSLVIVYSTVYTRRRSKKTSKRVTGLCVGNSSVTGEIPAQRASNAENISIWWRHHGEDNPPVIGGIPLTKGRIIRSFDVVVSLNKLSNPQSNCQWFETPWHSCK